MSDDDCSVIGFLDAGPPATEGPPELANRTLCVLRTAPPLPSSEGHEKNRSPSHRQPEQAPQTRHSTEFQ